MSTEQHLEYFGQYDQQVSPEADRFMWLLVPVIAFGAILLPVIVLGVPREHLQGSLLAYVNVMICLSAIVYFAKRQTIEALIPALTLPMVVISWPLGNIYWALSYPNAAMTNRVDRGPLPFLEDNVKLQLAVMIFLVCYLGVTMLFARQKGPVPISYVCDFDRWAVGCMLLTTVLITPIFLSNLFGAQRYGFIHRLTGPLYYYSSGLPFLLGVLYTRLSKKSLTYLFVAGGMGIFLSMVFSGRGLIARPILLALVGLFILSGIRARIKVIVLAVLLFTFPWYVLIGLATRQVGKGSGNFKEKMNILFNWRQVQDDKRPLDAVFGRAHWTGGHGIIHDTPGMIPYMDFKPLDYLVEMLRNLALRSLYVKAAVYGGTWPLRDYGFIISEENSVEISMIGHFWMLGGYVPVAAGATFYGLYHGMYMLILRRMWRKSSLKALTIFSILSAAMLVFHWGDGIGNFRMLVWNFSFGWCLYQFLQLVTRADTPMTETEEVYESYDPVRYPQASPYRT